MIKRIICLIFSSISLHKYLAFIFNVKNDKKQLNWIEILIVFNKPK